MLSIHGMDSGFYSPAFRMIRGQVTNLETITENLANSSTPGYRRLLVNVKAFDTVLGNAMKGSPNTWEAGEQFDSVLVDFTSGAFRDTGRRLDCAIQGDGFFVLQKDGGALYTRNGRFHFDPDGRLLSADGLVVQGEGGEITAPANANLAEVSIDAGGNIRAGEKAIGRLDIVAFAERGRLSRVGTTLFAAPRGTEPQRVDTPERIRPGVLEGSNTSVMEEMAALIQCVREYEACQRMLKTHDETQQRLVQQTA
jgi:flagellar basal-body rod protein FlgF